MEHKEDLIRYRISRAAETIKEVEMAIKNKRLSLAVNRIYYAIVYAVSSLALRYGFSTSKHRGLKAWFNQTQVKTKNIDVTFGKMYARAFEKRQKADYDDYVEFDKEEVEADLENAKKFVAEIKSLVLVDPGEPGDIEAR